MPFLPRRALIVLLLLVSALPGQSRAEADDDAPRFDVWEYRVAGNTVLPAADLERALYPHLGPQRSMVDIEAARQQLEALYRDRGFGTVFIDVPEQDVVDGLVRLQVTEGRLETVRISGPRYFSAGRIRSSLPALQSGEVVNLQSLQKQLTAVNRQSADRQVTPILRAGSKPGAVGVELKVKDELPLHASVDVNNRYTADTTQTRAGVNLSYDNLFQKFHRLSLQYQTAPENPDETRVIAATYIAPVRNDLVAGYIVDTSSDFATLSGIGSLAVLGTGRIYGLRYIRNLPETPGRFHNLTFGVDYKDFEDRIRQPDGLTDTTPMRYLNWSAAYGATWQSAARSTALSAAFNFGVRGAGNTAEEFEYKRYKAPANYLYLRASAQHQRPLFAGTSLLGRIAGQVAPEALISNEQFAIGGADTVRGYLEAEQLGDNGIAATLELHSPQFVSLLPEHLEQAYVFGFVDGGMVGILDPLPVDGQRTSSYSLAAAGLGFRLAGFGGLQTEFEWAYPFEASDDTARGDSRVHFQVLYGF